MVFTGWFVQMRRFGRQHSHPITLFASSLLLLVAGDVCLRHALHAAAPTPNALLLALSSIWGLSGLVSIGCALVVWVVVLSRYQLSFFYPLWGIATVLILLVQVVVLDGWFAPKALLGIALVLIGAAYLIRGGHSV